MSPCTGRRRRSSGLACPGRRSSRASSRTNCRPCSSPRTTSWRWSSSAARRPSWKNGSGRKQPAIGSFILAPVFGEYIIHITYIVCQSRRWCCRCRERERETDKDGKAKKCEGEQDECFLARWRRRRRQARAYRLVAPFSADYKARRLLRWFCRSAVFSRSFEMWYAFML